MSLYHEAQQRDLILFVGGTRKDAYSVCVDYEKKYKKTVKALYLGNTESADYSAKKTAAQRKYFIDRPVNFRTLDVEMISRILSPFKDRLLTATCTKEYNIETYRKIIPHIPYIFAPTQDSLVWATDKVEMRRRIKEHAPEISPEFMLVKDSSAATIKRVEKMIGFPLIVKPTGLAASKLVTICYYPEEFEKSLKKIFASISKMYKERNRTDTPRVLVEEFMDGTMYSIDAYVNARGFVYHCPPVHVKTGTSIGFDDFFGYARMAPVQIKEYKVEQAEQAVTQAVHALGLRNVTCHAELMKTEDGWKIIEIGPRVGGFRHDMYQMAYGINHLLNDVLIRIPQKPVVKNRPRQTVAVLQFFAKTEGILVSIEGVKKIPKLESFQSISVKLQKGDMCKFAKHGGGSVFDVTFAHKKRSQVLADIRRMEKMVNIKVLSGGKRQDTSTTK